MLLLVALGVVAPLVTFAVIARKAIAREAFGWDVTVLRHLYTSSTPGPTGDGARGDGVVPDELLLVGRLGDAEILVGIVALVVALLLVRRTPRKAAIFVAATAVASFGPLLKEGFQRPSPLGALDDHVFPSGHALGSMAVAAALVALLGNTRWHWPACFVAVPVVAGIGAAAVADGGHWPSDVVGGWALALAWVSIVWLLLGRGAVRAADGAEPGRSGASRPPGSLPERREKGVGESGDAIRLQGLR